MSLAVIYSRALSGMQAPLVEVEAHLANGLPAFNIVGLPDTEVKESRDRVRAAMSAIFSLGVAGVSRYTAQVLGFSALRTSGLSKGATVVL